MANPFYVQPASGLPGYQAVREGMAKGAGSRLEASRMNKQQAILEEGAQIIQTGTPEEISAFAMKNPQFIEAMDKSIGFRSDITKQSLITSAKRTLIEGVQPSVALADHADTVLNEGGDASQTLALAQQAQQDPQAAIDEAEKVLSLYDHDALKAYRESQGVDGGKGISVGAQEILEDGTTIQSLKSGGTVVYDPEGTKLTGPARAEAIQKGRAEKVANLRKAAGGKRTATLEADQALKAEVEAGVVSAKAAADASVKAYEKLDGINQNITNLNEVITLVDKEGAETGPLAKLLPSFRQAAVKMKNLQGRLGLDVIGTTTFGALSESELKFAMDTALPTGLEGPPLVDWAKRKIAAQEKLSDYIEASAIYLGTPGNTISGWVEQQRAKHSTYGRGEPLPEGVTEEDMAVTMQEENMTREQVLARLRGQ